MDKRLIYVMISGTRNEIQLKERTLIRTSGMECSHFKGKESLRNRSEGRPRDPEERRVKR